MKRAALTALLGLVLVTSAHSYPRKIFSEDFNNWA